MFSYIAVECVRTNADGSLDTSHGTNDHFKKSLKFEVQ